jgi:NAD(P)H-hydrate repair Nnr-like enzyme with NAD(P)H-hydrate dehydratase domain
LIILVGTVPSETGVYAGVGTVKDDHLRVGGRQFAIERGTAAMAGACAAVCHYYGLPLPLCIFGGDLADGKGTALMFREAEASMASYDPDVITLHYLFPKVAYAGPFLETVNSLPKRPELIADAGGMYLMKAAKKSGLVDVFTPDRAELAFLADAFAPHPLYVSRDMATAPGDVEAMVRAAYRHRNAARTLLIKGPVDYVYRGAVRVGACEEPNLPAMEAIGGTGDTITGMLSALRYRKDTDAELTALILNRLIGQRIECTPATQIVEFIREIPEALEDYEGRRKRLSR